MKQASEICIPEECTETVLFCAASTELPVETVVELALRFYLNRRKDNDE